MLPQLISQDDTDTDDVMYIRQKPTPFKDFSLRYPPPDPMDPFAPLSALRSRRSNFQGQAVPDSDSVSFDSEISLRVKHSSIDVSSLITSAHAVHESRAKRHTLKTHHELPSFAEQQKPFESEILMVPKAALERRRSLSNPTPVSPKLSPTTAPSPLTLKSPPLGNRRRPSTSSGLNLSPTKGMEEESNNNISDIVAADAPSNSPMRPSGHRYRNSRTQFPFLSAEAPSPSPTNKRFKLPGRILRVRSQDSLTSTSAERSIETTSEKEYENKPFPLSIPLPNSPSHDSNLKSPITSEIHQLAERRRLLRKATAETLPSLITSQSQSSSSSSSSLARATLTPVSEPSHHYRQNRRSLSHPRLAITNAGGPKPPTATVAQRPHTSSGFRPRNSPDILPPVNPVPVEPFDETKPPTLQQLTEAASMDVIAENGLRVQFGQLFLGQKTIVCFIRHFWCPFCQDYMFSISKNVDPRLLRQAGVNLVIISNGSYNMIKAYRHIFSMPFSVYTDPSLKLYHTLGMTRRSLDAGPDSQRGNYIRHGAFSGIVMVLKNALKTGLPLFEKGGEMSQLGGEFILGPGLKCSFSHRMQTTRSHVPILRVLQAAVDISAPVEKTGVSEVPMSGEERDKWMRARRKSLASLRQRKTSRRGGEKWCGGTGTCQLGLSTDNVTDAGHSEAGHHVIVEKPIITSPALKCYKSAQDMRARWRNLDPKKMRYVTHSDRRYE